MINTHILRVISENPYRIPFDDNTFDIVFSDQVFEHVQDYPTAISEIKRVLKPTGRLGIVSMPRQGHEDSRILRFYEWLHRTFPKYASCRPIYVEDSIRSAGFEITKTDEMMLAKLFPMKIVVAKP